MDKKKVKGYFCPHCGSTDVDWYACDSEDWIDGYEKFVFLQFRCSSCGKEFEAGVFLKATGFNFAYYSTGDATDYMIEKDRSRDRQGERL